jgi:hypothetical protein
MNNENFQSIISQASTYLDENHLPHGECCNVIEFPDGTVTLHFKEPSPPSEVIGDIIIETIESSSVIIVMCNLNSGRIWLPETL